MDPPKSISEPGRDDSIGAASTKSKIGDHGSLTACGPGRTRIVPTTAAGVPVHAVITPEPSQAPDVVLDLLRQAKQRSVLVTFANPSTAQSVRRSAGFDRDIRAFDLVLPDGIGMCMAIRFLHHLPARRVSFDMTSLAHVIFEYARSKNLNVVLVGGAAGVAARAGARLAPRYAGLRIIATFDGFSDRALMTRQIIALRPDVLICGMGVMEQEAFLLDIRKQGWIGWGFTCGGFLDQLQDGIKYYPDWVNRTNLRWAYRLIREPGRLWRRYLFDYSRFGWMVCAARVRGQ